MSIEWWRSWHGAPIDPKWLSVARRAQVAPVTVVAMVWTLFDHASQAKGRGDVSRYVTEPVCDFLGVTNDDAERVMKALRDIGVITQNGRLAAWEERQPKKEDETATERKRAQRQRDKEESDSCDVTLGHAASRKVTLDKEKSRGEKEKRERGADAPAPAGKDYAFKGRFVEGLNQEDFGEWLKAYPTFTPTSLLAELKRCDEYYGGKGFSGKKPGNWFITASKWMERTHERAMQEKKTGTTRRHSPEIELAIRGAR
jgi:hypothetical protein